MVTCFARAKAASVAALSVDVVVPVEDEIAGNVIEEQRRIGGERGAQLHHRRQLLVLDHDRFGGVARLIQAFGDDEGDGLADMAHFADRQQRPRRVVARLAVAAHQGMDTRQVAQPVGRDLGAGQHQLHAGQAPRRARVEPLDHGMGDRRAQHRGDRHAGQGDIIGIAPLAGEQPQILIPPQRLTDTEFHGLALPFSWLEETCRARRRISSRAGWRRRLVGPDSPDRPASPGRDGCPSPAPP